MEMYKAGILAILAAVSGSVAAKTPAGTSQSPPGPNLGIGAVVISTDPLQIKGDFYTQVRVNVEKPRFPSDDSKRKRIITSILSALGAKPKDTRNLTVTARISSGNITLPEYTIISYSINRQQGAITAETNDGIILPLHRLDPAESIKVELIYRDVKDTQYDFKTLSKTIAAVVPGDAVLSAVSAPFVGTIAGIGSAFWTSMSSGSVLNSYSLSLSPYGANNKALSVNLTSPTGESMGVVKFSLWGTPTVLRASRPITNPDSNDGLRLPFEDTTVMGYSVGGVDTSYLAELRKLPSFAALAQDKTSRDKLQDFCGAALEQMSVRQRLTSIDRLHVLYNSMIGINFPREGAGAFEWFNTCFLPEQRAVLRVAKIADPPVPVLKSPDNIKEKQLWAFGCWMRKEPDPSCLRQSPDAEATLRELIADQVSISVDSSFLQAMSLGNGEVATRDELLAATHGSISGFSCFRRGMLLKTDEDEWFRLEGELDRKRLVRLNIRRVPSTEQDCTS